MDNKLMAYNLNIKPLNEQGERISIDTRNGGGFHRKMRVVAPDRDTKALDILSDKIVFPSDLETKLDFTDANVYKIGISTSDFDFYTVTNFKWHTASNTDAMVLDASTGTLTVSAIALTPITTVARDALSPLEGWFIMNGDRKHLEVYNGTEWRTVQAGRVL